MRYFIILLFVLFVGHVYAQDQHHRAKVYTGQDGLAQMAAVGIAVDHGEYKRGTHFISDFSDSELQLIASIGLQYEIMISNVGDYYAKRSATAGKPTGAGDCIGCNEIDVPENFSLGSMGGFFTYNEMLTILDSMQAKFPNLITVRQVLSPTLTTSGGRPVYFVKISDNPGADEAEPEALYTAVHHAREAESLSQLIFFMWHLLEKYDTDPEVKYLVDHTELYFVPCLNPDGYIFNSTTNPGGGGMWRKNRRNNGNGSVGVDLNRNYGMFWGYDNQGSSANGNNETYRGPSAFSEPETQMMRDFCNSRNFGIALNAHTFSNLLIYPWGHVPSLQTPDSLLFRSMAEDMTECSHFVYGTGNETVGYVTNGDSDDWMYGEQTSKNKIFALTPEAGNQEDGFWPVSSRIIPIAQQTMDQNMDVARLSTAYARVETNEPRVISSLSGFVHFDFARTGLAQGNFTVSLIPLSSNIVSVGPAVSIANPSLLAPVSDSLNITLSNGINAGATVQYGIRWQNADGYGKTDTITRYFGVPDTVFFSDGNTMGGFASNSWAVTTTAAVSGSGSITDSPNGDYGSDVVAHITTDSSIDLTNAAHAFLSFSARWDIEAGYDYVTISVAEGNVFTPLCGKFTHPGNENQASETAVYDGRQQQWIRESIDLSEYVGKMVKLRFSLHSDPAVEGDGFYFDDLAVVKLQGGVNSVADLRKNSVRISAVPNPASQHATIFYQLPASEEGRLYVYDPTGRLVRDLRLMAGSTHQRLDLSNLSAGIYVVRVLSENGRMLSQSLKLSIQ